ncbi:MAG: hypothetical protein AAF938_29060 [Myxococcota bacterium]
MRFALALVFSALAASASAQSVEEARRHYLEAEFEEAIEAFEGVLARPSVDRAAAVESHAHLLVLRLLLGDPDAARGHASFALALDPAASVPAGAPPEAAELLSEVRSQRSGAAALLMETLEPPQEGEAVTVVASLENAPDGLLARLQLRCASGEASADEEGEPPDVEVSLVVEDDVFCRASASTASGGVLLRANDTFSLGDEDGGAVGGDDDDDGGVSPWVWVGVGAGVLAVAAVVVTLVLVVPSDQATLGAPMITNGM